jgi:hypothetical protein
MGRTLKRVPLDFSWPTGELWKGYINPHYRKCPDCENGSTKSGEALSHLVHLILIAGGDSLTGKVHPWLEEAGVSDVGTTMHELTAGLAGRSAAGRLGHDACDRWSAVEKIVVAAGLTKDWGCCLTCKGEAIDPAMQADYDAWEDYEPPTGEGFQLWETTTEGSPASPVFSTLDELCAWCATGATTFGICRATAAEWRKMLDADFVHHSEGNAIFL